MLAKRGYLNGIVWLHKLHRQNCIHQYNYAQNIETDPCHCHGPLKEHFELYSLPNVEHRECNISTTLNEYKDVLRTRSNVFSTSEQARMENNLFIIWMSDSLSVNYKQRYNQQIRYVRADPCCHRLLQILPHFQDEGNFRVIGLA